MKNELFREIERMKATLLEYGKEFVVNKGASDEDIARIERIVGIRFDDDFKDFYKFSNGSQDETWGGVFSDQPIPISFLSLESALEEWKSLGDWSMEEFRRKFPRALDMSKLDRRVKPFLRHRLWFPFGEWDNNTIVYYDADPTEQGKYGQIIVYQHDPDFVYYVADCFLNFLRMSNDLLKKNQEWFEE